MVTLRQERDDGATLTLHHKRWRSQPINASHMMGVCAWTGEELAGMALEIEVQDAVWERWRAG
ncbi:hypothetical protein, partial [Brachybacterium sacelli]|uniref:hypothetical protein n=1 Tax=Brachybacterium sacelli TaxID=173364 RepID=UPI0031DFB562